MMEGMLELAERILDMPVRQDFPLGFEGLAKELAHSVDSFAIDLTLIEARKGASLDLQNKPPSKPSLADKILSLLEH